MSESAGPDLPPRPQRPRRTIDMLTPALLRRFADVSKWARGAGIALIILGFLLLIAGLWSLTQIVPLTQVVFEIGMAVTYLIAGALMLAYGKRVARALVEEPSINIELAMMDVRRFWTGVTLCAATLTLIQIPLAIGPGLKAELRHLRMEKSAAALAPVRDALERYAAEYHSYPNVKSYADLRHALQPYGHDLATRDPSGKELRYSVNCADGYCSAYTLSSSAGEDEVIVANGQFTQAPKEWLGR